MFSGPQSDARYLDRSGTSVEHNVLYEYQFVSTKNVYMGQIQTETASVPLSLSKVSYFHSTTLTQGTCRYYQSNPSALIPFKPNPEIHDPDFASSCDNDDEGNCEVGWGLRVVDSKDINVYGGGLYSFFDNYDAGQFFSQHVCAWCLGRSH